MIKHGDSLLLAKTAYMYKKIFYTKFFSEVLEVNKTDKNILDLNITKKFCLRSVVAVGAIIHYGTKTLRTAQFVPFKRNVGSLNLICAMAWKKWAIFKNELRFHSHFLFLRRKKGR